jgi:hypothetical protein
MRPPVLHKPTCKDCGMQTSEILDYIRTVAVFVGAISVSIAIMSYTSTGRNNTATLFLSLRKYFLDIHAGLCEEIPDLARRAVDGNYALLTQYQQSIVQKYWINSFNEWYTTTIIYRQDKLGLWKNFYREAQATSLTNSLLRSGLEEIFCSNFMSFGTFRDAYRKEIISILNDIVTENIKVPTDMQTKKQLACSIERLVAA